MKKTLKYKNYHSSVNFSTDDNVFYGRVLDIIDLVSFEGVSIKKLKNAFEEAIEDHLETCETIGKVFERTERYL